VSFLLSFLARLRPPSPFSPCFSFPRARTLTGSRSVSSDTGDRPYPCDQCTEKFSRSFVQPSRSCRSRFDRLTRLNLLFSLPSVRRFTQGSPRPTQGQGSSVGREPTPAGEGEARDQGKQAAGGVRCGREARCKGEEGVRGEREEGEDVHRVSSERSRV
jgi:hypothetical protein